MASTTPRNTPRPEQPPARPEERAPRPEPRPDAVPMRALLASCRAAEAVSTPPERDAA
ncbi:hypothetical protein [Kitasatospora sp. NPDC002522]